MRSAKVAVFNPVPVRKAFAQVLVEILEDGRFLADRDYDPERFVSYEQLSESLCGWLNDTGVTEATVTFLSLRKSARTGDEQTMSVGKPYSFNPQVKCVQFGELAGSLR